MAASAREELWAFQTGDGTAAPAVTPGQEQERQPVSASISSPMLLLAPGDEDPKAIMQAGGVEISWGRDKTKVSKFEEHPLSQVIMADLALPSLYLHFLDARFRIAEGECDESLRAGNDNAEIQLVVPEQYTMPGSMLGSLQDRELAKQLIMVKNFLKRQAQVAPSAVKGRPGGWGMKNYIVKANPRRWYFTLATARPKAPVNFDRNTLGIPENAELYLFAHHHPSASHLSNKLKDAVNQCILGLPDHGEDWKAFSVFLKIFFEGGFAYNSKRPMNAAFLPISEGIAALGTEPAFVNQTGIASGYPYKVGPEYLNFAETVPVTIDAIKGKGERHARYGICFTRCVFVWEPENTGEAEASEKILKYSSVLPHGGFFYTPATLEEFGEKGGFIYAFGEDRRNREQSVSVELLGEGLEAAARRTAVATSGQQVCVICLERPATHATVPCGHRAYCAVCAPRVHREFRECAVCRQAVASTTQIFI